MKWNLSPSSPRIGTIRSIVSGKSLAKHVISLHAIQRVAAPRVRPYTSLRGLPRELAFAQIPGFWLLI